MKKVIVIAVVAVVAINLIIGLILYQKKIIFQPKTAAPSADGASSTGTVFVSTPQSIGKVEKISGSFSLTRDSKPVNAGNTISIAAGDLLQTQGESSAKLILNDAGTVTIFDNVSLRIKDASHLQMALGKATFNLSTNLSLVAYASQLQATPGTFTVYLQPNNVRLYVQSGGVKFKDVTVKPGEEATITATEIKVSPAPSTPSWVLP